MKDILIEKDVLELVEATKLDDIKDVYWKKIQNKAAITIHQCLSHNVRYHIVGIDDLVEMWKTLAKCYEGEDDDEPNFDEAKVIWPPSDRRYQIV